MRTYSFDMVYITDQFFDCKDYSIERKDAEGNSREVANSIRDALGSICNNVVMYDSISPYIENIAYYKNHVMFSTRYGVASPSSKALIPAICESNNIAFVGADSYTHMLCNDKYLSKRYIEEFGLQTAKSVLIRDAEDVAQLALLRFLRFPVVIKPNYGGGSNGISNKSVQSTIDSATNYIKLLQKYQCQPIIVEEYIPGYEVEVILFGNQHRILLFDEIQLRINGHEYFTDTIYDLESKKIVDSASDMVHCNLINHEDKLAMIKLFHSFKKVEFMRIDCRICNGIAYVLELSPDCYLGKDGGVYSAFERQGFSFPEMFSLMVQNSLYPETLTKL